MQELGRITVRLDQIVPNPMNAEIYGPIILDEEFIQSVRDSDLIQKPVITPIGDDMYEMVAGHRRHEAKRVIGSYEVECDLRAYDSDEEKTRDFIASNKHRTKDYNVLVREILAMENTYQTSCQPSDSAAIGEEIDALEKFRQTSEQMSAGDVALQMGVKPDLVKDIRTIHSPQYREQFLADLKRSGIKVKKAALSQFLKAWDKAAQDVMSGRIKPYQAASAIRDAKNVALGKPAKAKKGPEKQAPKYGQRIVPVADSGESVNNRDNAANFMLTNYDYGIVPYDEYDDSDSPGDDVVVIERQSLVNLLFDYGRFCSR